MSATLSRSLRHQPKTQEVCSRLTELAHSLGPEAKLPSVLELRDGIGVSLGTLNSAMKVLEADNIIYRIQGIGVFVSPSLQRHVSLICTPDFFHQAGASPFWQLMVESASERAEAKKEAFSCHFSVPGGHKGAPLHAGLAREIEARELHGVLGIGLSKDVAQWIEDRGVPFVAFAGPARWIVALDACEVIELGIAALVTQGCTRLSYWSPGLPIDREGVPGSENEQNRRWKETLQMQGVAEHDELLFIFADKDCIGKSHQEQGFGLACQIFSKPRAEWPDGIVISDDLMTHGALLAMDKLGVRVGKDVQIATHSNRNSTVFMGREHLLTRLEYDPAEIVQTMFGILETAMDGGEPQQALTFIRPSVHRPV